MAGWPLFISALAALLTSFVYLQQPLFSSTLDLLLPKALSSQLNFQLNPDGSTKSQWNQLYHLGGNSPWIPKVTDVASTNITTPTGCRVDQVHMMSRHAERYPTVKAGSRMLALYNRIAQAGGQLNGSLEFVNDWDFLVEDLNSDFENLVSTGPYAGTLEAFTTGVKLRTRYMKLLDQAQKRWKVSFWASGSHRVEETAQYFGAGFFGLEWQKHAKLVVVPETEDRGADTLTPGDTCLNYADNVDEQGHDYGARMLSAFRSTYLPAISARLGQQNPALTFSDDEVYAMQEMCGFETIAKGSSPWCEVFTEDEWESFEYARDVLHYYRAGPGNPYGQSMGFLWLNATANLLREGAEAGELFFSFVHDGDITPMLAALNLFPQIPHLPTTHVLHNRTWRTSDVTPMGGRIIFERMACRAPQHCWDNGPMYPNHRYCEPPREDTYVRININDGIVALPWCEAGPGNSCPLEDFLEFVRLRGEELDTFGKMCGLQEGASDRITFLHQ